MSLENRIHTVTTSKKPIKLSPSALSIFRDCPCCFWYDKVKGHKRPRGIFPSLPNGMDRVIKDYFDHYRKSKELPPELRVTEFSEITLYENQRQLNLWRQWRTGPILKHEDGSILSGAVDDLMMKGDRAVPLDYKTKGSPTTAEDAVRYYQHQLDCYTLLFEAVGLTTDGYGYLLYYSPKAVGERGNVKFHIQAIKIETSAERALKTFRSAVELIGALTPPQSAPRCEYCAYLESAKKLRLE